MVQGLREGIRQADRLIDNTPMLRSAFGLDLRGHIRRIGILYQFQESARLRELPFRAEATKMPIGSWHWLDIYSDRMIAHVVRTDSIDGLPAETSNRQPQCARNEYDLFRDGRIPPIEAVLTEEQQRYAVLTFGVTQEGDLTHAALGMQSGDNSGWLAFLNLLRRSKSTDEPAPPPPSEPPDPLKELRFLRHVEKQLEEQDKKSDDERSA
jgi:hypothetical protein